ncbi:MAG: polymer-forming cytoskeletal protein [Rectinema sp.]
MNKRDFSDCVIGEGVVAEGKIDAPGMVRIDGAFSGDIISGASVIISKDAVVHAHIRARDLVVAGVFGGTAVVRHEVRYTGTARVQADCTGDFLVMESGALVKGKFSRNDRVQ